MMKIIFNGDVPFDTDSVFICLTERFDVGKDRLLVTKNGIALTISDNMYSEIDDCTISLPRPLVGDQYVVYLLKRRHMLKRFWGWLRRQKPPKSGFLGISTSNVHGHLFQEDLWR